jgi:hypothetical protein
VAAVSISASPWEEVVCSMQRVTYIIQVLGLLGIERLRHFGCFGGCLRYRKKVI